MKFTLILIALSLMAAPGCLSAPSVAELASTLAEEAIANLPDSGSASPETPTASTGAQLTPEQNPLAGEPCFEFNADCLNPSPEPSAAGNSWDNCRIQGKRVCLITLGAVEKELIDHLASHFRDAYGLEIKLGPALPIPDSMARSARLSRDFDEPQLDGVALADHIFGLLPGSGISPQDLPGRSLIALTTADTYTSAMPNWVWAFGTNRRSQPSGGLAFFQAVISFHRMDNRTWELPYSDDRFASRVRKMVSKYIGLAYYDLSPSSDPRSVMYGNILGLDVLDRMGETLPVQR